MSGNQMSKTHDFQFLSTAEMVEHYGLLKVENEKLQKELNEAVEFANYKINYSSQLLKQLVEMQNALEYYANPINHYRLDRYNESPVMIDEGAAARRALRRNIKQNELDKLLSKCKSENRPETIESGIIGKEIIY